MENNNNLKILVSTESVVGSSFFRFIVLSIRLEFEAKILHIVIS